MPKTLHHRHKEKTFVDEAVTWSSMLWRSFIFLALLLLLLYVGLHWPG